YALYHTVGTAHPHEIAGLIVGIIRAQHVEHTVHDLLGLADRKSAYRKTAFCVLQYVFHALHAQVFVHIALHYREQHLTVVSLVFLCASFKPAHRTVCGAFRSAPVRISVSTLVESHDYIRAERMLYPYREFGRHEVLAS